ncbi:hypothetical protein [Mesorhizobium sp.]|uniref:hypothetical protein n=1 Tax=Mesorhizobium sp. TaxID=1871066 RepID=UPI00120BEB19|nr:hypothetical protein [Mesorhizobium sp.]TIM07615.1 MAG: hypothetical protein E5Y62_18810 [Mesorhizobium sp.]
MQKLIIMGLIWASVGVPALGAQEIIDDSEANVPDGILDEISSQFAEVVKDPSSLQLRKLAKFQPPGADYDGYCGEFNAKNSLGGYVGFDRFIYLPKHKRLNLNVLAADCPSLR